MSLGSGVISLLDIIKCIMIANGGIEIQPKIVSTIFSKEGKVIFNSNKKKCLKCNIDRIDLRNIEIPKILNKNKFVIDPKIAYQITSMMEGVVKRGTAKKLNELNVTIAGKTGTTNDNKDAWFIGYTPDLVIGVYVGYDKPKSLGYKQTGSSVAVPIFKKFSNKININATNIPFRIPSGLSFVRINPKSGLPSNKQDSILEPYILGTEPYNNNFEILDNIDNIKNNSISGTGGLLQ